MSLLGFKKLIDAIVVEAKKSGNGKYLVKRGVVSHGHINYDLHPFVWAITADSGTLFESDVEERSVDLSFDISTRINASEDPVLDDDVLNQMLEEAAEVLSKMWTFKDSKTGDSLAKKFNPNSAKFVQYNDADFQIQGVIVVFKVDY